MEHSWSEPPQSNLLVTCNQIRAHFDAAFYLANNPDVAFKNLDPIVHYLLTGWLEGRDPHPDFSTRAYLKSNPDVEAAGINPFFHYITTGTMEGRKAFPSSQRAEHNSNTPLQPPISPDADINATIHQECVVIGPLFDREFYLERYPDVASAQLDPVLHYCTTGWRQGRDPHPNFSTQTYLDFNADIKAANLNPYWHYLVAGKIEERVFQQPGGAKEKALRAWLPIEETAAQWMRHDSPGPLLASREIRDHLLESFVHGQSDFLFSVGHDHYKKNTGGVQLCIQREEEMSTLSGRAYCNIHPWQPLPLLARAEEDADPVMSLVLNGSDLGQARASAITAAVEFLKPTVDRIDFVIHSLLGHSPEVISRLIKASGNIDCWFWLHDFATICPGYTLQRNGIAFCGAPEASSNACGVCLYGGERPSHLARLEAFFQSLRIHILSPSEVTKQFWCDKTDLPHASISVAAHMELSWAPRTAGRSPEPSTGPVKIAYVGNQASHKGWPIFCDLAKRFGSSRIFSFAYFGTGTISIANIERKSISVTSDNYSAMMDALAESNVDFVLQWSTWPETFSFTTHEALAGGAFVLTNNVSGNIAAAVRATQRGAILDDEEELIEYLESGRIMQLAKTRRRLSSLMEPEYTVSGMTVPYLDKVS